MGAVDVRNEVHIESLLAVGLERLGDHDGTEVGTSDTDVDDRVDRLARVTLPFARAHFVREVGHVLQHALDLVGAGLVNLELVGAEVAERDVEDGAVLGRVDVLAREHVIARGLDVALLGELDEVLPHFLVDQVLRVVDEDVHVLLGRVVRLRELFESLRVRVEQVTEDELGVLLVVELLEGGPRGVICTSDTRTEGSANWRCVRASLFRRCPERRHYSRMGSRTCPRRGPL